MTKKIDFFVALTMAGLAARGALAAEAQPPAVAHAPIAAPEEGQAVVDGVAYRVAEGFIERREADGSWRPLSEVRGWRQVGAFKGTLFSLSRKMALGTLGGEVVRWNLRAGQYETLVVGADKIAADDGQLLALVEGRLQQYHERPTVTLQPLGGVPGGYASTYGYFDVLPEGPYRITDLLQVTRDGKTRIMVQLNGGAVVRVEDRYRPAEGAIPKGKFERFIEQFR